MDEAEFARHFDLGHENARIMELATNHCRQMRFGESGGRAALEAWTTIGGTHALPSTVADLLPALVSNAYVVVIDAVLAAACRLPWPDQESRIRLAVHAATVAEGINVSDHLGTFLTSLSALRHHVPDLAALAELEKKALARVPELEWHQASKVTEQPWQPDARIAPELAVLWLALPPRHTYGLRQRDEAEDALNGLLDCGAGLLALPAADIIKIGAAHSPESRIGSMEYAEVFVVGHVRVQNFLQVVVEDQDPVQELRSDGAHPPFGVGVREGCSRSDP